MEAASNPVLFAQNARRLRLDTLSRLRWLAISGQLLTVLALALVLKFPLPLTLCLGVIGVSALLNLVLRFLAPKSLRLGDGQATALLTFDVLQLAVLLYLCGGLENPFSILFLAPVTIAAVSLPARQIALIALLIALAASFLGVEHRPLPWYEGQAINLPSTYRLGIWSALIVACAFICAYAARVAGEARTLSQALTAADLVLARENHLSQLDGLAAAAAHELGTPLATIALVARELSKSSLSPEIAEDIALLNQEALRCRSILGRLTSLASQNHEPFSQTKLGILIERVVAPHRHGGSVNVLIDSSGEGPEPLAADSPAIVYGLGNFIENAVDFAETLARVQARWTESTVEVLILDDGPGFPLELVDRIGDPYVTSRVGRRVKSEEGSGLGLGLFIAKTLLERTGAEIVFSNRNTGGARVRLRWNRRHFEKSET